MKIANVESDVLFPVPYWVIDFDDVEDVNRAILQEIDRVDWDAEHRRQGCNGWSTAAIERMCSLLRS